VLRSDVIRKLLLGVDPETRLPGNAYTRETSRQVYDALRHKAAMGLEAGYSVIIDAVALMPDERRSFAEVARSLAVPFSGFWLEGPVSTLEDRIRKRHGDASDATSEILLEQMRNSPGPIDWISIDASGGPEDCAAAVRRSLAAS
jgi:predicted kinase